MAMFCRLQTGELYFSHPWKCAAALTLITVFLTGLPLFSEEGDMEGMVSAAEDLVKVFIISQAVFLYLDLVSEGRAIERMMVPATCLEKYAAFYAGTALAGIIITVFASVLGSMVYLAAGHFMDSGQDAGIRLLFFRDGGILLKDILVFCLVVSAMTWAIPFVRRKKEYGTATVAGVLAACFLLLFLPGLLKMAGLIPAGTAKVLTLAIMPAFTVANFLAGYAMLKKYEYDRRCDD